MRGEDHSDDISIDGKIISECILKEIGWKGVD
jgi:hypothetical protein